MIVLRVKDACGSLTHTRQCLAPVLTVLMLAHAQLLPALPMCGLPDGDTRARPGRLPGSCHLGGDDRGGVQDSVASESTHFTAHDGAPPFLALPPGLAALAAARAAPYEAAQRAQRAAHSPREPPKAPAAQAPAAAAGRASARTRARPPRGGPRCRAWTSPAATRR